MARKPKKQKLMYSGTIKKHVYIYSTLRSMKHKKRRKKRKK